MHLNIRRRLFLSHFFAVLLVSGSTGGYFYFIAARSLMETIQSRLENSAALIGQTLDATELESIRDASDRTSPIYERTLDLLRSLGRTNPDIAFVYVMRHSGGRVYFVLDSDESEQQALPGREYMERMPSLMLGFQRPSADDRVYEDEWGSFMSGYAPLRNGNGEYLVGLDMRAEELQQKLEAVRIAATLSLALCHRVGGVVQPLALIPLHQAGAHLDRALPDHRPGGTGPVGRDVRRRRAGPAGRGL